MEGLYKKYAKRYKPKNIRYLVIGESPPYTPNDEELRYFYNDKNIDSSQILLSSVAYSFINKKFYKGDNKKELLKNLVAKDLVLIDATYEPINKIKNQQARISKILEAYPQLKQNINQLSLSDDAKIFLIHNNVVKAIGNKLRTDFNGYRIFDIGFPRYYNDDNFKRKIQADVLCKYG